MACDTQEITLALLSDLISSAQSLERIPLRLSFTKIMLHWAKAGSLENKSSHGNESQGSLLFNERACVLQVKRVLKSLSESGPGAGAQFNTFCPTKVSVMHNAEIIRIRA